MFFKVLSLFLVRMFIIVFMLLMMFFMFFVSLNLLFFYYTYTIIFHRLRKVAFQEVLRLGRRILFLVNLFSSMFTMRLNFDTVHDIRDLVKRRTFFSWTLTNIWRIIFRLVVHTRLDARSVNRPNSSKRSHAHIKSCTVQWMRFTWIVDYALNFFHTELTIFF